MTGGAEGVSSIEIYRPVIGLDGIWLDALKRSAEREKITGVNWLGADCLRATLLDGDELLDVMDSQGIALNDYALQEMAASLRRHLRPADDTTITSKFYPLEQQCLWQETDPDVFQLAIAHVPSEIAWERYLVRDYMQRRYGVPQNHPYWLPPEAGAIRLAEGASGAIASLHVLLEPPRVPRLFTPAQVQLGKIVVATV